MSYLLPILSAGFVFFGALVFVGRESLLRIPRVDGPSSWHFSKHKRWAVGGVLVFVGMLLSATTYSIVVRGDPYWFIEHVFQLFT
jgi:hypothetical protein